jgi:uncharacterized protein (TIGR02687 family)
VIQHYIKFFGSKARTQAFYDLELENFNQTTIEITLMSVLCKCKTSSYEEVVRTILTADVEDNTYLTVDVEDNTYLTELGNYDLLDAFWRLADDVFGYSDPQPTLEKFVISMFVTYADKTIDADLPVSWKNYVSYKSGSVIAFLDNLMNSLIYGEQFDKLSDYVFQTIKGNEELKKLPIESLASSYLFAGIDELMIQWMTERLELEDVGARLENRTIPELIKERRQKHFGRMRRNEYFILENAWYLISNTEYRTGAYQPAREMETLVKHYTESGYQMDRRYRYYYFYLDKVEMIDRYEKLTNLIENIYTNDYLEKICVNWNELYSEDSQAENVLKQSDFYNRCVNYAKDQVVVIISDALRYEVGVSLLEKLQADEKCKANMKVMQTGLPSVTRTGMASLLPHKSLELSEDYSITVDGMPCETTEQRQTILQSYKPNSKCLPYDEIRNMSITELKNLFAYQDVVYIYHNQIDARGDKLTTENEVFNACEEAVNEIHALIRRLTSANKSHFIITADHGFLYKRKKLEESDKISFQIEADAVVGRRYCLSVQPLETTGTMYARLSAYYRGLTGHAVSCPVGADVFKAPGSGMNYVHGGSSPQEMLVPLIEVKTERGYKDTSVAQVALVSLTSKITNLITSLDFVQTEPISDLVKETTYRIYFVDGDGEKISNEQMYIADNKSADTVKRMFRLRFSFKNKKYDKYKKYYLVAYDDKNNLEVIRHEVMMDIAFADDFGF